MATVQVDRLGRVLIPKEMRDAMGLRPGERLVAVRRQSSILLHRRQGLSDVLEPRPLGTSLAEVEATGEEAFLMGGPRVRRRRGMAAGS